MATTPARPRGRRCQQPGPGDRLGDQLEDQPDAGHPGPAHHEEAPPAERPRRGAGQEPEPDHQEGEQGQVDQGAVADFPRFGERRNPDRGAGAEPGFEIDSNPNGLLVRHRSQLVTDAGGNDLLKVDRAGGFTNIIDVAFDGRGRLYVLEIATNGLLSAGENELPVGRLVRVNRDGSRMTLASEGLNAPGGFVLGHGAAYITNSSILSDAGQVVKVAI
jgi:hypothetical protein